MILKVSSRLTSSAQRAHQPQRRIGRVASGARVVASVGLGALLFGAQIDERASVGTLSFVMPAQAADRLNPFRNNERARRRAYQCEQDRIPVPVIEGNDGRPVDQYPVEIEGDSMDTKDGNTVVLTGDATVIQGPQAIGGDKLIYNKDADKLTATGNVFVYTPLGDRLNADDLEIELDSFVGEASNMRYKIAERDVFKNTSARRVYDPTENSDPFSSDFTDLTEGDFDDRDELDNADNDAPAVEPAGEGESIVRARGDAGKVYFEGHDLVRMEDVSYTTCVEGQDDVIIKAGELELDQSNNVGTARNVTLRFKDIPIFYLPYVSFPISSERKTGFLFPGIGRDSESGLVVEAPWYWNIAPNLDATITPRLMQDRGVQLAGEFRYLSDKGQGVLRGEVLPGDDLYNEEDRNAFSFRHDQRFSDRMTGYIDVQHASDDDYFDDFETDVNLTSSTHLPQRGQISYRGDIWSVTGLVAGYQTLDDTIAEINRPYDRLPQITFNANVPPFAGSNLKLGFKGEVTSFDRDAGVTGTRVDLTPSISLPYRPVYGYVVPKLSVRASKYSLDGQTAGLDDSPSRTVPIFSVDSGLYFERGATWGGKSAIQTLEPRLFYVYIPEEDQNDIPNFDTSEVSLNNMSNIYRENRFFGADRVGDTNQITLGLTTRMLDADTGEERLRAGIGQAFFLDDRYVTSGDSQLQTRDRSDFLAELDAKITDDLEVNAFLQYDTDESEVASGRLDLDYQPELRKRLSVGYRYFGTSSEQIDMKVDWPLGPRWDFHLRERYSIDDSRNLETSIGLGYDACCWGIDFVYQRRLDRGSDYKNVFFLVFELTGLGRVRAGL